jgi:DNA-damage-inducible protein D
MLPQATVVAGVGVSQTDKLAEVVAMIVERDDEFRPFLKAGADSKDGEELWSLSQLKALLGYTPMESIDRALHRAKISASTAGWYVKDHFIPGSVLDNPGEVYLTKYAALLVTVNADPDKPAVAVAQSFFILQADRQALEDEERLRARLEVSLQNTELSNVAVDAGVSDFQKFHGAGLYALYGLHMDDVRVRKKLPSGANVLDHACSEELAANLFRITQTAAQLRKQGTPHEETAINTHQRVALKVRDAIIQSGNTPPEDLPPAELKINKVATKTKNRLTGKPSK